MIRRDTGPQGPDMPADPDLADSGMELAQALRAAIIRGEFLPHQRLVEADLCQRYSASRSSVRTALQELSSYRLVEFERNRGARVREIPTGEAIEITEVRRLLEGMEAARAAERATKSDIVVFRRVLGDMQSAVNSGAFTVYSQLNAELHGLIQDVSAHETAARVLRQLRDQTVRHQFTLSLVPGRPRTSLPQHEAIVRAIIAHDSVEAERAMRVHLDSVIQALQALAAASTG